MALNLFKKKYIKVPNMKFSHAFREIGRNAFVDWLLILLVNALVIILTILGGAYLYWQVSTGNFTNSQVVSKSEDNKFNEKELNSVISLFKSKEDKSAQIKYGYRGVSDPSL